ncbi:hypothetical protein QYM36_019002 [Artemia franciscana]|uniref:DDE Tnp4 domain-containing protein n=2 Tax=Artemia franciscana TaxID=6661 RepID=A0AA88KR70_ARTSF|nr:hypothetical protein QYM36_019002 [Artemia franciscana]
MEEELRIGQGPSHNLMKELIISNDVIMFANYVRMTPESWNCLLGKVFNKLEKSTTNMRIPISPAERLCVTIRYLADGKTQKSLMYEHRHGHSTIVGITTETMTAIIDALKNDYLPKLSTENMKEVANYFYSRWNLPNCCGAIDGKHIQVVAPYKSGSTYYNYKNFFSIVLMAVCDADYKFTFVDIGAPGSRSDGGVFSDTQFARDLDSGAFRLPPDAFLPGSTTMFPNFIVGDEAFPLKSYIMRPYPGQYLDHQKQVFNYRLSRARRIIENCFGILAAKWRIFFTPIHTSLEKVNLIVMSCVCLHNFLRVRDGVTVTTARYINVGDADQGDEDNGQWRNVPAPADTWDRINRLRGK